MKKILNNSKIVIVVAIVGIVFCTISLIISIINQYIPGSIIFLLFNLYCTNFIINNIKDRRK